MFSKLQCSLYLNDHWPHTRQVVVGFCELAQRGDVKLKLLRDRGLRRDTPPPVLRALINGRTVLYDVRDGYNFSEDDQFDSAAFHKSLDEVDFYFKRSFDPARHVGMTNAEKVRPLGLNYLVALRGFHPYVWERTWDLGATLRTFAGRQPSVEHFEGPPTVDLDPKVLFMARVWDPDEKEGKLRDERHAINDMRADCIRAARKEFASVFYGGLALDDFAQRHYPDCLLPSAGASGKKAFLKRVRESSICVATTGLHGSIGWKMAEYVAASKAIVSEPLNYVVPGNFVAGQNYLEFVSTDDFVCAVTRLLEDAKLRHDVMRHNWTYYQGWVRPDALVMNSIMTVLEG